MHLYKYVSICIEMKKVNVLYRMQITTTLKLMKDLFSIIFVFV